MIPHHINSSSNTPAQPWGHTLLLACALVVTPLVTGAEPRATDPSAMHVLPEFSVELLYSVPQDQQGSWVSMCHDDKGRLIVSDQDGGLYRIIPPALGSNDPTRVESIDLDIGHAQGLVYA